MRSSQLCPGAWECPDVLNAQPLATPQNAIPCAACPSVKLAEYSASPLGHRLSVVLDLDFALQVGFHLTLRDVSYLDFRLLRILAEERKRFNEEDAQEKYRNGRR